MSFDAERCRITIFQSQFLLEFIFCGCEAKKKDFWIVGISHLRTVHALSFSRNSFMCFPPWGLSLLFHTGILGFCFSSQGFTFCAPTFRNWSCSIPTAENHVPVSPTFWRKSESHPSEKLCLSCILKTFFSWYFCWLSTRLMFPLGSTLFYYLNEYSL